MRTGFGKKSAGKIGNQSRKKLLLVLSIKLIYLIFFFQAEDGIRDTSVTGVQTCALPISFLVVADDEESKRGRIASNRRVGPTSTGFEGPVRIGRGAVPVAGQKTCLHRPDRAAPASRRRVGEALPVTLGGSGEAGGGFFATAGHQQRKTGSSRGVAEPRELALARV